MPARTIPASDELSRRIRAASAYGGFKSVDKFAAEIGLGRSTLFRIFRGERGLKEMEARQMAIVAGLPLDWFEADFSRLEKPLLPSEAAGRESGDLSKLPRQRPKPLGSPSPQKTRRVS